MLVKKGQRRNLQDLYRLYLQKQISLNDHLAAIRSIMANERTFLAYQRMSLAMLITGFGLIKFFGDILVLEILGWSFLPASLFTILLGTLRYRRMRDLIFRLENVTIKKNEHPEDFTYLDKRLQRKKTVERKEEKN